MMRLPSFWLALTLAATSIASVPVGSGETIHTQFKVTPQDGETIDLTGKKFLGLEDARWPDSSPPPDRWPTHEELAGIPECSTAERFPVSIRGGSEDFTVRGGHVRHLLHHQAPWHVWKLHGDGDGIRAEGRGRFSIVGTRIDNVEDAVSPRGRDVHFTIRDLYATRVHDDAIENDQVHSGELHDSFVQTHTFYSARGGSNSRAVFTVSNCIVELILQPHQGGRDASDINSRGGYPYPDGLGCGVMFKMDWDEPARSGTVDIRDTVFLIPRHSASSNRAMQFAPGRYERVTVVWLGQGDYPWLAPPGVTLVRDRTALDRAKEAFIAAHRE